MSIDNSPDSNGPLGNGWEAQALINLEAEFQQLAAARDRIEARMRHLEEWRPRLARLVGAANLGNAEPDDATTRAIETVTSMSARIREAARKLLEERGTPAGRREILDFLATEGVIVSGSDPARTVSKVLHRSPEFLHVKDGYWLADRPPPDA